MRSAVYFPGYYQNNFSRRVRRKRQKNSAKEQNFIATALKTDLKEKSIAAHISVQYDPRINILKTVLALGDLNLSKNPKNLESLSRYFDFKRVICIFIINLSSEQLYINLKKFVKAPF